MFKVKYFNSHFKFILYLSAKYSSLSYREHAVIYESHYRVFQATKNNVNYINRSLIINLKFKNNVFFALTFTL